MITPNIRALVETLAAAEARGLPIGTHLVPLFRRELAAIAERVAALEAAVVPPAARAAPPAAPPAGDNVVWLGGTLHRRWKMVGDSRPRHPDPDGAA